MARINDVFVTGTIDNLVLYRRMGKSCARIRRAHIKQTTATKKRGINFGIAARAGKGLRAGLVPVMPEPANRSMQSRFSGSIAKWLGQCDVKTLMPSDELPFVSSFQFTEGASFGERFKVPLMVSLPTTNHVSVTLNSFIPSKNIAAPAGTHSIRLVIAVAAADLTTGTGTGFNTQFVEIPFDDTPVAAKILNFDLPTGSGTIIITAGRLLYYGAKNNQGFVIVNKAFNPAGVINAMYC